MSRMNPDIKTKWVAALRSGEYKQGTGTLYDPKSNTYCCLGVLCDLAVKEGLPIEQMDAFRKGYQTTFFNGNAGVPPHEVAEWAEFPFKKGVLGGDLMEREQSPNVYLTMTEHGKEGTYSLAELNDERYSFEFIAQLIEEQL